MVAAPAFAGGGAQVIPARRGRSARLEAGRGRGGAGRGRRGRGRARRGSGSGRDLGRRRRRSWDALLKELKWLLK
ncbi:hypothetical protein DDF65_01695 [Caulobacter radicis]|uniref:Uncharacterized protein n=1 Tax=Caulobacter radicis TaxID=2172650 RepID=A0A2T9JXX5_9CAUL|nr:hypothetical protein DDF65_01695 [Caulobacter radicis]